jgi:hypothetical protein
MEAGRKAVRENQETEGRVVDFIVVQGKMTEQVVPQTCAPGPAATNHAVAIGVFIIPSEILCARPIGAP